MSDLKKQLDDLLDAVDDKKKTLQASATLAKNEFLEKLDQIEEKVDDIDKDSLKMRLTLAKLKIQEEWDEVEEKIDTLGDKAKQIAGATESEVKEGWGAMKELAVDIEQRISEFFSKKS